MVALRGGKILISLSFNVNKFSHTHNISVASFYSIFTALDARERMRKLKFDYRTIAVLREKVDVKTGGNSLVYLVSL